MSESNNLKLGLLKSELSILSSRLQHQADIIWRLRQVDLLIWAALLAYGTKTVTQCEANVEFLILICLTPIVFWFLEAKELKWYMRYDLRMEAIRTFLNQQTFIVPATGIPTSVADLVESDISAFPVCDLSGVLTYGNCDSNYVLQSSILKHMTALSTMLFYASQIFIAIMLLSYQYFSDKSLLISLVPPSILLCILFVARAYIKSEAVRVRLIESLRGDTLVK